MTWYESAANQTAAEAEHVEGVVFVDLDLPSGHLRLHTRTGTLTFGGNDYLGVGKFGGIEAVTEDAELRPFSVSLKLSGVDSALMTAALTEEYHGRAAIVYFGLLDTDTLALIADPEMPFRGLMDTMQCELGPNTGTIVVTCEHEFARWRRHQNGLYTHESQATYVAGDRGFDQVPHIQQRTINWSDHGGTWGVRTPRGGRSVL